MSRLPAISPAIALRVFLVLIVPLVCASIVSLVYVARQGGRVSELAARRDQMSAELTRLRGQLDTLSAKLDALSSAPRPAAEPVQAAAAAPEVAPAPRRPSPAGRRVAAARTASDPRWKRLQVQLSDQQKQIAKTREELDQARQDLRTNLQSTREELSGSIARNHDEVVALQKRGERNYYEFRLTKSKEVQRVGPLGLWLRKANTKRKSYDVTLLVDDFRFTKKGVNLYEPVWINLSDRPEPLQLVVNQIDKNQVRGYLSEPKFKKSELAASTPAASGSERQPLPRPVQ